jgi:hypothetical protein
VTQETLDAPETSKSTRRPGDGGGRSNGVGDMARRGGIITKVRANEADLGALVGSTVKKEPKEEERLARKNSWL